MKENQIAPAPASRLDWLDLFRGVAVIWMIETHVANTFLQPAFRATSWFGFLNYANGLVAPAFLFIAGYALGLPSRRKNEAPVFPWKKLRRLGGIALLGYALHFPWGQISAHGFGIFALPEMWQVDILQCLAVSLGILVLVNYAAPPRLAAYLVPAMLVLTSFSSGLAAHWRCGWLPLDAYLNANTGSLFPLLPWAGFAFGGYFMSRLTLHPVRLLAVVAATGFLGQYALPHDPAFFYERFAWLIALAFGLMLFAKWRAPLWLLIAGRQSLVMYTVHLLVIHLELGPLGSLNSRIGATQTPLKCVTIFAGVLAITLGGAWLNTLRQPRR